MTAAVVSEPERKPALQGRDEMNLAEFPLGALGDRISPGVTRFVFSDQRKHPQTGEWVNRSLTISPSAEYGLPTAADDEVILGLIQISKLKHAFQQRQVEFRRAELLDILRWPRRGWSYRRLAESLNRWVGVTLYYENAWWDSEQQSWISEKFHILDNVTEPQAPRSPMSITWNQVILRDVQRGNLKRLDLDFLFRLNSPGAKRAYRYLDKRFHNQLELRLNLRELACEHIGLSRNYHTGELKRRLQPILAELERLEFLAPATPGERYTKIRAGEWSVTLKKPSPHHEAETKPPSLKIQLIERGIADSVASRLVKQHPAARITEQLRVFDWLRTEHPGRISRNPAGYLVQSIQRNYSPPLDYRPHPKSSPTRTPRSPRAEKTKSEQPAPEPELDAKWHAAWENLSPDRQTAIERMLLTRAPWLRYTPHKLRFRCLEYLSKQPVEQPGGTILSPGEPGDQSATGEERKGWERL